MPIAIVNNQDHSHMRVRPPADFKFLSDVHMLPLVLQECGHAGNEYPVVFTKKEGSKRLQLVAVFSLSAGRNAFVTEGMWHGLYLPAIVQNLPFKLVNDMQDSSQLVLGVDTASELVSESEGERLFDDAGDETEYLQRVKESLGTYYEHDRITQAAIEVLEELELLVEAQLTVTVGDQSVGVNGVYTTDIVKLKELDDDKFNDLRDKDILPLLYAQIFSINQFHRLARYESLNG